jgi:hypothetical protein
MSRPLPIPAGGFKTGTLTALGELERRARPPRIASDTLEGADGPGVGPERRKGATRPRTPGIGAFRVIGRTRQGRPLVRELKQFPAGQGSRALRYFGLAAACGVFDRVELHVYESGRGWQHTRPVVRWRAGEPLPALDLGPLFATGK